MSVLMQDMKPLRMKHAARILNKENGATAKSSIPLSFERKTFLEKLF